MIQYQCDIKNCLEQTADIDKAKWLSVSLSVWTNLLMDKEDAPELDILLCPNHRNLLAGEIGEMIESAVRKQEKRKR